ncbi:MAG: DUF4272 domain-containing protein [Limisphaerales bacterium]
MSPSEESEAVLIPPKPERVLARSFCISALICRSFLDPHSDDANCMTTNGKILPWIEAVGAGDELELWEAEALAQPMGSWNERQRVDCSWMSEGLVMLVWALSLCPLPTHDECVDPKEVTDACGFLRDDGAQFGQNARLRSVPELKSAGKRAFAIHWRTRQFQLDRKAMDFENLARTAWFGPLDIAGVALVDSDLSVGDLSLFNADPVDVHRVTSIARERHRAANWLLGECTLFSEVDTST